MNAGDPGTKRRAMTRRRLALAVFLGVVSLAGGVPPMLAQIQMPDPKQMSGIPRPVTDLPAGTVSVRVIRGELSNNLVGQAVELHVNGVVRTEKTDEGGRAQFSGLAPDARVKAVAVVDGERLESEEFSPPAREGIRLMLVATDKDKEARAAAAAKAPAVPGEVVLGGETRIVIEPEDERLRIFYLLEIMNNAQTPVDTSKPFMFDTPTEAISTTVMEGSSKNASASGRTVRVLGPFPPGPTFVQVGYALPARGGAVDVTQTFPAHMEQLAVIAQKTGSLQLISKQLSRMQEMPSDGTTYIAAVGGVVPAGAPVTLSFTGIAYHSRAPRWFAFGTAVFIVAVGLMALGRPVDTGGRQTERKRLLARREKLLQELVRLEGDQRRGRVDATRFAARREDLLRALEQVYSALDGDDTSPEPADRPGLAA